MIGEVLDAVERAPSTAGVEVALAVAGVFHQARRLDRAERYYLRVLDAGPHLQAYVNLGHICHFTGRLAEAIEWRQKADGPVSGRRLPGADLGTSLISVGRRDEGVELLRRAAVRCRRSVDPLDGPDEPPLPGVARHEGPV